jgi:hypothetical protein
MSVKVPTYILIGINECVGVESTAWSVNQENLMNSHCWQQGGLPLMYASAKVLINISNPDPRWKCGVIYMYKSLTLNHQYGSS